MFGNQEKRCDDQEHDQCNVCPGLHPADVVRFMLVLHNDSAGLWTVPINRNKVTIDAPPVGPVPLRHRPGTRLSRRTLTSRPGGGSAWSCPWLRLACLALLPGSSAQSRFFPPCENAVSLFSGERLWQSWRRPVV